MKENNSNQLTTPEVRNMIKPWLTGETDRDAKSLARRFRMIGFTAEQWRQVVRECTELPAPLAALVAAMNENNAASHYTPYSGYEVTETGRKYHLLNSIMSNDQRSACFMIDRETFEVFRAEGYGRRGRRIGHTVETLLADYNAANAANAARKLAA